MQVREYIVGQKTAGSSQVGAPRRLAVTTDGNGKNLKILLDSVNLPWFNRSGVYGLNSCKTHFIHGMDRRNSDDAAPG